MNTAKFTFSANTAPKFADKSDGVWRRLVLVPLGVRIPSARQDPRMLTPEFWADELPGILGWALEGLRRLREQGGFTRSEACEQAKNRHRVASNPARAYLLETLTAVDGGPGVHLQDVYDRFQSWCKANGYKHPLPRESFAKEIGRAFPKSRPT